MLRRMTWIGIPLMAFALVSLADSPKADAGGGFAIQIGGFGYSNFGYGYRNYHSYRMPLYRHYVPSHGSFYRGHRIHHPRRPHLDYFPPQLVPHGNHFDYIPGHYHLHHGHHCTCSRCR